MILVDTSAWVEYDRATGGPVDQRVRSLIDAEGPLGVCEPIMMAVLAGARDDQREADLRRLLRRFHLLRFDPVSDFDAAVHIYRRCRGGQTRRCWRTTPTLPGWPGLSASRSTKRPVAPRFPAMTTVGLVGTGSMGSARGAGLRQSRSARSGSGDMQH